MCGIFGVISDKPSDWTTEVKTLAKHAQQRGRDASGVVVVRNNIYEVIRSDTPVLGLLSSVDMVNTNIVMRHSRLVTKGIDDNQPVVRDGIITLHNGIVVNADELWSATNEVRKQSIDTEIIPALVSEALGNGGDVSEAIEDVFRKCSGSISVAVTVPSRGRLVLMTNNGSLYTGSMTEAKFFSSEEFPLRQIGCEDIKPVIKSTTYIVNESVPDINERQSVNKERRNLLPAFLENAAQERLLEYEKPSLRRCSVCILPETMPFIRFDEDGVCNYCLNYKLKNQTKPLSVLEDLIEPYRRRGQPDCIVPFSGGRDSNYALHLAVKELGMRPITNTYDWGMVTDLARRNISRMCSVLNVENSIVEADTDRKRNNIRKNLNAWLRRPHLGMLTAAGKHFFQYVETVKKTKRD